ncbi:MAG: YraN family protein [Arsenophonus endosymbiont of Dermacentor nuttalli]
MLKSPNLSWIQGRHFEYKVKQFLQQHGLQFISRNVRFPVGEINLIMKDQATWVFVEVRFRRHDNFGNALMSVTLSKRKKLLAAAKLWLLKHNENIETALCRFDIFAITDNQFEWLPNAFSDYDTIH